MYRVVHSLDQLGGVYEHVPTDLITSSLSEAVERAEELTAAGQCGVVVRTADHAILAPDGRWIIPYSKPI